MVIPSSSKLTRAFRRGLLALFLERLVFGKGVAFEVGVQTLSFKIGEMLVHLLCLVLEIADPPFNPPITPPAERSTAIRVERLEHTYDENVSVALGPDKDLSNGDGPWRPKFHRGRIRCLLRRMDRFLSEGGKVGPCDTFEFIHR